MASITKQIADTVTSTGVGTAYGEPVELDGTTLVPVAVASYGFGASDGSTGDEPQGAGGGGCTVPIGAYVTRDGYTRFEPNIIALLAVAIPFVCVTGRALARVIRALKK